MNALLLEEPVTLVDELLAEQRKLTAVERFSRHHDESSARESIYRALMPVRAPRPGEQYAFEVNLDACSSCKACVAACHSLNGLEENETWRGVGLLHGVVGGEAFQQTVTTACHHCIDPGCLNGCPVKAYDKDPFTGIVRHLDDQCIGCQYCIMKCPYEVPKYSKKLGIVRKCDLCSSRTGGGGGPRVRAGLPEPRDQDRPGPSRGGASAVSARGAGKQVSRRLSQSRDHPAHDALSVRTFVERNRASRGPQRAAP